MSFMRFLGGRTSETAPYQAPVAAETEAVRHIVARLEALPAEQARMLAGMAYVLARAAYADLEISDAETAAMEVELKGSGLDESQAGGDLARELGPDRSQVVPGYVQLAGYLVERGALGPADRIVGRA
ncbi:MAG: hypothetical protein ACXWNI_06815, partial [Candidatus Limnocylindrales bacterium]